MFSVYERSLLVKFYEVLPRLVYLSLGKLSRDAGLIPGKPECCLKISTQTYK